MEFGFLFSDEEKAAIKLLLPKLDYEVYESGRYSPEERKAYGILIDSLIYDESGHGQEHKRTSNWELRV